MNLELKSKTGRFVLTLLLVAGLSCGWAAAAESSAGVPVAAGNRQVTLTLPKPDKISPLPDARRYMVWDSIANKDGWPFGHGAMVSVFKGRVVCVWYVTTNYEAQDYPRQIKVLASSAPITDLNNWTPPADIERADSRQKYFDYLSEKHGKKADPGQYIFVPRGLLATADTLYLFTLSYKAWDGQGDGRIFRSADGIGWTEIDGRELDKKPDLVIRNSAFNHHPVRLTDGRWMAPIVGGRTQLPNDPDPSRYAPITTDPTGMGGWQGGKIDCSACPDVGEPAGWQGRDGVIHYAARYLSTIWHAYSEDDGKTWTKLAAQERFSDGPANKEFGPLPDGGVWYAGNPYSDGRRRLVFAVSHDGWNFDRGWLVRWEDWLDRKATVRANLGYDYPAGVCHDGRIYLFYSADNRQRMELTVAVLLAGSAVLAADPVAGNAAGQPKLQPGLAYELFGNPALERVAESGSVPDVGPMDKGQYDWGIRFTGLLTPPTDGDYLFRAEADMGVRLKLDGKTVIDGWAQDGARTGKATLKKANPAAIVIEYFFDRSKGGKKAELRLFWTPPGGQEAPLPSAAYTHVPPAPPPPPPPPPPPSLEAIEVRGDEQRRVNLKLPDGGLKPVVGVHNIQVLRACRGKPDAVDQDGWTYAHHQDLAVWRGRLYAAWAMTPKDEDVPPYKVVYATSTDGITWSAPADLFPRENAWACRFYFYRASNGCMLALCAGKSADGTVQEAAKKVLLVRRITAEHQLDKVFTLVAPLPDQPPSFDTSSDPVFVAACREAAGNNLLLEQQDYGRFLGDRRMKWHDDPTLKIPGWCQFGKAFCFYHRADGDLVGLCKMGFATLSEDAGKTWSKPVQPPSLIAGSAKIWGQRTADGRFALAYTPDRDRRYPLVLVYGEDGHLFSDMRVVHGELPRLRYQGKSKDIGAQYMRGLAEWADDGTLTDRQAMWLVYSVNKEDIWVARIPLPIKVDETEFVTDDFAKIAPGAVVTGWNLYSPKWAPASVVENAGRRSLELRDGDPFDYARAVRVFPESAKIRAELDLTPAQANARLEIELCDAASHRPIRVMLTESGLLQAAEGKNVVELGKYTAGEKLSVIIAADMAAGSYNVQVNGGEARKLAIAEAATTLQRLSLRTGVWRGLGDGGAVNAAADVPPATPAVFQVQLVKIAAK